MPDAWRGKTLGILGGGNMAEALVRGVVDSKLLSGRDIVVFDPLPARREVFRALGCLAAETPQDLTVADAVLLATKPQKLQEALGSLVFGDGDKHLFISIAAGVPVAVIEEWLPPGGGVIRVMPNTPLLVGMGVSALAGGRGTDAADMRLALSLFSCCGEAVEVDEKHLDAVTALSGSGPAYLFLFAEALMAGGEKLGLTPELSEKLTVGTLRGSAEMLFRHGDAATLRERVTSPGGTTAAALEVFGDRDLPGIVAAALAAARRRGHELGRGQ